MTKKQEQSVPEFKRSLTNTDVDLIFRAETMFGTTGSLHLLMSAASLSKHDAGAKSWTFHASTIQQERTDSCGRSLLQSAKCFE
eukprot:3110704-Amphidinium_carterae.1